LQACALLHGTPDQRKEASSRGDLRIGVLGSDFAAFLDDLGIASLNLGYGGEDEKGIYHSIYDDFSRRAFDRARAICSRRCLAAL